MEAATAIRQLLERGPLPAEVVQCATREEIVPHPDDPSKVMLRAERDLLARVAAAASSRRGVPWSELPVRERLLFRQQAKRLGLKRLARCGSVFPRGVFGVRSRRELLGLVRNQRGGVNCFEVFAEYPDAHQDVIDLLAEKKIVFLATTLLADRQTSA